MSAINHAHFNGVGNSNNFSTSLPNQALLESQKNEKWVKAVLDRLEQIGESQLARNIEYISYYKMLRGELIYSDYGLPDLTKEIVRMRDEMDFPVHAKHYDFLGIIVNQIKGEYLSELDKFHIDNTDPISQNDFIRTKTEQIQGYTQKMFNLELEQKLLQRGININEQVQFETEEEQQAYLQQLEQTKASIISPNVIEKEMSKNWKTQAAEWAERTLEYDYERFKMDSVHTQEIEDYLLTGRFFRHYATGYDFYKPERWHPCTTFFSEDIEVKFPQEAEYVGRIHWLSPSDLVQKYGYKLTDETQRRLLGYFNQTQEGGASRGHSSFENAVKNNFSEQHHVPFAGYYDYDLTLQLQDVFETPMGETYVEENGERKKVPAWFSPINNGNNYFTNAYARELRSDIEIRNDLLQVTEVYWRSFKRVGVLTFETEDGLVDQQFTTDNLLPEFLKENDIKKLRTITLEQGERNPEPNTIYYTWIPETRWGVKVKAGNSYLLDDLYIGGDSLDFQIKGTSNIYDSLIPVGGFIGDSTAKKLRPFIVQYNIVLNQIYSLLEKELGTFFLFDVHYLPSEYKNNGNTRQALEEMYTLINELGIVPVDTSKQNMQGNQPAMNAFMTQSLDFTAQISNRMALANSFKLMALEQIGITQQRLGSPSEYSTAEGIKQGQMASFAQTAPIYQVMNSANKELNLLHLNIAQYCQKNYKDFSFLYTKSDGEKAFIELSDPNFPARMWGIISTNSSKDKKNLETLKQALLQNNTMDNDILNFAEVMKSDSFTSLVELGRQNRLEKEKQTQAQREHEQVMLDKQIQAQDVREETNREHEKEIEFIRGEFDILTENIQALGRASDKKSDSEGIAEINKATQDALNNNFKQQDIQNKVRQTDLKEEDAKAKVDLKLKEINLKLMELQEKKEQRKAQERISIRNKN